KPPAPFPERHGVRGLDLDALDEDACAVAACVQLDQRRGQPGRQLFGRPIDVVQAGWRIFELGEDAIERLTVVASFRHDPSVPERVRSAYCAPRGSAPTATIGSPWRSTPRNTATIRVPAPGEGTRISSSLPPFVCAEPMLLRTPRA